MRKRSDIDLGMAAATSAAITLWHRLLMLAFGPLATAAELQAEATRMVNEKTAAFVAGCAAANLEAMRIWGAAATGRLAPNTPVAIAGARPWMVWNP